MFDNQENKENRENNGYEPVNSVPNQENQPEQGAGNMNNQSFYHQYQNDYNYHGQNSTSHNSGNQNTAGSYYTGSYGNGDYQSSANYQAGTNSYQATSGMDNQGASPEPGKSKKIKIKKAAKPHPFLKKMVTIAACGLGFGLCLGLGVYVVGIATGSSLLTASGDKQLETTVQEMQSTINNLVNKSGSTSSTAGTTALKTTTGTTVVTDVTDVVKNAMPSVVSVTSNITETGYNMFGQQVSGDATSEGSGIIVGQNDTELLVVTNNHVIADADTISVKFIDGTSVDAQIKGTDSDMDLAVLAIPLANISADTMSQISIATLGDSESLQVGEPAIAIGNALGYGQSVTTGVISAVDRPIDIDETTTKNFIQTDAAINPGNSGGALLNIDGEVIGINSNKIGGEEIDGMGFAIPISSALPIIQNLMTQETLVKVDSSQSSYLGIGGVDVTSELAQTYSMPEGVYVTQIYDNTAAAQAGLEKGDVITEFDGHKISTMSDLQDLMQYYAAGTTVDIKVMRISKVDYEEKTISVTLGNKADATSN